MIFSETTSQQAASLFQKSYCCMVPRDAALVKNDTNFRQSPAVIIYKLY
jgi:hypothetical protein